MYVICSEPHMNTLIFIKNHESSLAVRKTFRNKFYLCKFFRGLRIRTLTENVPPMDSRFAKLCPYLLSR